MASHCSTVADHQETSNNAVPANTGARHYIIYTALLWPREIAIIMIPRERIIVILGETWHLKKKKLHTESTGSAAGNFYLFGTATTATGTAGTLKVPHAQIC